MSNRPFVQLAVLAIGAAAVLVSCSDPETRMPTSPSVPGFAGAEIVAPAAIPPGQSVQLTANARFADGTVKAVEAATIRWFSESSFVSVTPAGLATAGQTRGEVVIFADVTLKGVRRTTSRSIAVMPEGTFRVVGSVRDGDAPNPGIAGARVEVGSGDPTTFTDSNGLYRLYGVPPAAEIRVSAPGYLTDTRNVSLSANSTQNFLLGPDGPRATLSGNYTLGIDVMDGCSGSTPLAAPLRHRTYDAQLTQNGALIDVLLTEPRFRVNGISRGNRFTGLALGAAATFRLDWFDSYYYPFYGPTSYPNVAEALSDGTYLTPSGTATLVGSATSGPFIGSLVQWDSRFPSSSSRILGLCSGTIRLSFTPR